MPKTGLILKNANVLTMDRSQPRAELVAIEGNRISLVGGNGELREIAGADTRIIDCQGKTTVPGFNDAHCHIFSLVRDLLSIDLSPSSVRSIADMKAAISQRARSTLPGDWIIGANYNEFYLAERRHPNRWDIDEAAPNHPVILTHRSLHACVLNSLALKLAGITQETPEPPGALIDRNPESGEPNGILFEMLGYIRERVLPPLSEAELAAGFSSASQYYLSHGITSLQEASVTNNLSRWQALGRLKDSGQLKSRVSMMFGFDALPQFQEAGLAAGAGSNQLRLGGVKIMLGEATGEMQPSPPELNHQVTVAHQAGFQLAIHAVQSNAVGAAVTALESLQSQQPDTAARRHRLEHCAECPPDLLARLRRLRTVIVSQPPFLYYSGERYLAMVPPQQLPWLYRFRSFMESGLKVAASSDSPVVPADPLIGIYAAVTRRAETGQVLSPEESVSPYQAIAMYTADAAYASFEEDLKGSITHGKLADMVVLSDDPTKVSPEEIKNIKVEMTIVDGKVVWD